MKKVLKPGDQFPNFELPDQNGRVRKLSDFTRQGEADKRYGFKDGYPRVKLYRHILPPFHLRYLVP